METHFVGVDVCKAHLDVAVRPTGEIWAEENSEQGATRLVGRLRTLKPALVVLEATGGLEHGIVLALAERDVPVVLTNARLFRDFAKATGGLVKTDQQRED